MPLTKHTNIYGKDRHMYYNKHKTYKHYNYSFIITLFKHLRNSSIFKLV